MGLGPDTHSGERAESGPLTAGTLSLALLPDPSSSLHALGLRASVEWGLGRILDGILSLTGQTDK